jgi:hypothetical protein
VPHPRNADAEYIDRTNQPRFGKIVLKGMPYVARSRTCRSAVQLDRVPRFPTVVLRGNSISAPFVAARNRSLAGNGQVDDQQFSSATDVPVRLGDKIIGLLQLGRPALEARVEHFKASENPNAYIDSAGFSRSRYGSLPTKS